ncbi:uncharacterized protein LOC112573472 [Pomacea canaliculata]|uniref:uncharacterized protein LOC112573472 n=1 Tax=Pomacea canaliculata TaxID=400727 RepID=UPI000D73F956|nr:uncharacterized protein LOC112573472 [Pomacea canaliculata]
MESKRGNKAVWGFKRSTALTVFLKRLQQKEGESNTMFLARGSSEYAALSPLEKKHWRRNLQPLLFHKHWKIRKIYIKQLVGQLKKMERVLLHIGVAYYFEMGYDMHHVLAGTTCQEMC